MGVPNIRNFRGAILLFLFLPVSLFAHKPKPEISSEQKLFLTAKVWGFLKYYHPIVNEGKINWDKELTDIIDKLPDTNNKEELSALYVSWIVSLGEIKQVKHKPSTDIEYFDENFNLSWINHDMFTDELSKLLTNIEKNRAKKLYYIKRGYVGQIAIANEQNFTASQWSDPNVRLNTLFRYWNVIEYFYPYKYKIDKSWDEVLLYFIPRFRDVQTELDYHFLINELTVSLCDSHSSFRTDLTYEFTGKKYIPADFKIMDDKAVIAEFYNDSLARLDDLRLGDAVVAVNQVPVIDIYQKNEKYIGGSNTAVKKLENAYRWIFNGSTDSVNITFERDGVIQNKTIRRYAYSAFKSNDPAPVKWKRINNDIGYVNMEEDAVLAKDLPAMMKELWDTKAIIFDFRKYPEFIIKDLLKYLNPSPKMSAIAIEPDLTYPGRFRWTKPGYVGKNNSKPYQGRVIILADQDTQSRSEYFVMAMQTVEGSITIGRQTSGADGDVLPYTFFDDKRSTITGRGIFYPDKTETQRVGIRIDIEIPYTREDITNGRDAVLEKAIEIASQF